MTQDVTAQPLFDGTFSIDAVASAAHARVQQLHDEAMATIAALADDGGRPVEDAAAAEFDEPVTYRDPATWSVQDDEDDLYGEEDDEVRMLQPADLPPLLRPRPPARNVTALFGSRSAADSATDEFDVPARADRQFVAF